MAPDKTNVYQTLHENKIISQEKEFEIPSLRRVSQSEMIKVNDSDLSNIKVCYVNAVLSELSF